MKTNLQTSLPPMEINSSGGNRPSSATVRTADQSPSSRAQAPSIPLIAVVKDVLVRHFGSLKAAAYELKVDQGQLSRDLVSGDFKFKRLEAHTDAPILKLAIAKAMAGTYGEDTPKSRKRRVIRALRQHLDELEDIEDAIAS